MNNRALTTNARRITISRGYTLIALLAILLVVAAVSAVIFPMICGPIPCAGAATADHPAFDNCPRGAAR